MSRNDEPPQTKRAKLSPTVTWSYSFEPAADSRLQDLFQFESDNLDEKAIVDVVQENPCAAMAKYRMSYSIISHYPIYFALKHRASFYVIDELYRTFPYAVMAEKCSNSQTLLHCACAFASSAEVISLLLEGFPEAAEARDNKGNIPLHHACESGASLDTVSVLIDSCPSTLKMKNDAMKTPLHRACESGASPEVINLLLGRYLDAVAERDRRGKTPLHRACESGASFEVVSLLLERGLAAVAEWDMFLKTPLHCACEWRASFEVISLLIDRFPAALERTDYSRKLPIHHACESRSSLEVISLLIEKYPEALLEYDSDTKMPLHYACECKAPPEVVCLLLENDTVENVSGATTVEDFKGMTPLHSACRFGASLEVILLLLKTFPEAAGLADRMGKAPLDHAKEYHDLYGGYDEVMEIVRSVRHLVRERVDQTSAKRIMNKFIEIEWWDGVVLLFDLYPPISESLEDIPLTVIPSLIYMMTYNCKFLSTWYMISNRQDLLNS